MYLPRISAEGRKRQKQNIQFGGLNRTRAANEGELSDATGVSAKLWPCLTTRSGQTQLRETGQCTALFAWGKLVSVEGSELRYGGEVVGTVTPGKKQFAVVNTKLCIFPDKKYLDLTTKELGDLQAEVVNADGLEAVFTADSVTFAKDAVQKSFSSGATSFRPFPLKVEPGDKGDAYYLKTYAGVSWDADAKVWSKTEEIEADLSFPSRNSGLKVGRYVILKETGISGGYALNLKKTAPEGLSDTGEVITPYGAENARGIYGKITKLVCTNVNENYDDMYYAWYVDMEIEVHDAAVTNQRLEGLFQPGDRVTVSGCAKAGNNHETLEVKSVEEQTLTFVTIEGQKPPFTAATETGKVSVCRKVPDLDFICESGNRLWGVSNKDKTIYASALGDPTNFYIYDGATVGNSMLSYAVPVGTDGDFTAICAYGSNVLCWKEHCLHKVLGTMPANYEVFTSQIAGVQAGSAGSLQIINEVLYYKGREGVYAYTGSTPQLISAKLAPVEYGEAVAGHTGRSYVISMKRTDTGVWETLSYGTDTGLWLKETEDEVLAFANLDGALYLLTPTGILLRGGETDGDGPVPWEAVFVPFTETVHNKKGYSRLLLRLELGEGAWAEADVSTDNGPFRTVWTGHAPCPVSQVIPIRPGRCDRFQVRLRGEGRFVLSSMAREYTLGSVR